MGGAGSYNNNNNGWLIPGLRKMVETKAVAVALQREVNITVVNASLQQHGYQSMDELVTAFIAASQGDGAKDVRQGALNANVSNMLDAAASPGIDVAAWRLRLTASDLNFAKRPIFVSIGRVLNTAGVFSVPNPVVRFVVYANRAPADIIVLSPSNANGLATIIRGTQAESFPTTVTSARNGVVIENLGDANTFGIIESLNSRDLIAHPKAGQEIKAGDFNTSIHDMFSDNGEEEEGEEPDMFG